MQANLRPVSPIRLGTQAVIETLPLCIAVIPWGILTGALALQIGLSPFQAQFMSLVVYAGAVQLSAITMMAGGAPTGAIFASTFVISSRHLLYSVVFRQHVANLSKPAKAVMAFVLTDEMFAVSEAHTKRTGEFSALFALISGFTFYVSWNASTLVGIVVGTNLTGLDSLGLDFAIVATFIAMTFGELRRFPILLSVFVSGTLAVMLKPLLSDSYIIIAAISGMLAAYFAGEKDDPDREDSI